MPLYPVVSSLATAEPGEGGGGSAEGLVRGRGSGVWPGVLGGAAAAARRAVGAGGGRD